MTPRPPSPPVPPTAPAANPAPKPPSHPSANRQPPKTSVVSIILDEPIESNDKFELKGESGSYREIFSAADAKPSAKGERILNFKLKLDPKGYWLFHHRSTKGMKQIIFKKRPLQGITKAGQHPRNTGKYVYFKFISQVPNKLPDRYHRLLEVDKDLIQASPVLVELPIVDPES